MLIGAISTIKNVSNTGTTNPSTFNFPTFIITLDDSSTPQNSSSPSRYDNVTRQLNILGINNYHRWRGSDGTKVSVEKMVNNGVNPWMAHYEKGSAGCSLSHIRLWKYIAKNKLDWCLILEDDVEFHPEFVNFFPQYWKEIPSDAIIVYPGYCSWEEGYGNSSFPPLSPMDMYHKYISGCGCNEEYVYSDIFKSKVESRAVLCTHAYMINHIGAQYLLDNILPMTDTVDQALLEHFKTHPGSYIFKSDIRIKKTRPSDYKKSCGNKCTQDGIVYQNRETYPSIIHDLNQK